MKISMISEHASPLAALGGVDAGGQNVHVAALSTALVRRGHEVTVYTRRDDDQLPARVVTDGGVEVVHIDAGPPRSVPKDELLPYMDALADGVARDWAGAPPDLVHGHFWMSGLAALNAAAQAAASGYTVPVVQTFHALGTVKRRHQGAEDTSPAARALLEPSVGCNADRIIATCTDEVFELKAMGVSGSRVSVVPCGVDLDLFGPAEISREPGGPFRIASVGRLVPRKGVELVIRALRILKDQGIDDVELAIVGGGAVGEVAGDPEAERLLELARELGVDGQVRLRGQVPRERMPLEICRADAVVCAPWYEPFGIVPLEAMACGVPVIAAAVGGLIDTVVDGRTGLHVPPRDPEAIADAVLQLRNNPEMAQQLGRDGLVRVRGRYSWDRIAADSEKAYQAAIATADTRRTSLQRTGGKAL